MLSLLASANVGKQSVVVAVCSLCAEVAEAVEEEGRTLWQGCQLTEGGL